MLYLLQISLKWCLHFPTEGSWRRPCWVFPLLGWVLLMLTLSYCWAALYLGRRRGRDWLEGLWPKGTHWEVLKYNISEGLPWCSLKTGLWRKQWLIVLRGLFVWVKTVLPLPKEEPGWRRRPWPHSLLVTGMGKRGAKKLHFPSV